MAGKVSRRELRAAAAAYTPLPDEVLPPHDQVEKRLRLAFRKQLEELGGMELLEGNRVVTLPDCVHVEAVWPLVRDAIAAAYKAGLGKRQS